LAKVRVDEEFIRLCMRDELVVQNLGVIGATLGDGLERYSATYEPAVSDFL
jgi:hypothetical protein